MSKIKIVDLYSFSVKALTKIGVSEENAEITAKTLVSTDMFGVVTHGTKNLGQYIEKIEAGGLDAKAEPTVMREGPAFAIINGNKALGMVTASKAMRIAIEKAKKVGIAYVGVKNSCHFGAAGYYANLAAKEGLLGISMSNTDPVIAVPNGAKKAIGTNPFSFAAPTGDGKSVFLDIALSNVAALKVIMAQEKGMAIPDTWLVDEDGKPTTDASLFPQNASLQPMAAHKGYGLCVLVEILSAVMTGAGMLSEVASWNLDMSSTNNAGHAFIAIDIAQIMDTDEFNKRISQVINELKNAPKEKGKDTIFLPGEMEWNKYDKAEESGELELTDAMANSLLKLADKTGIEINIY
ncbi:MAG: Ldh family oxidoreductase [Clostridia bacterium]|nr:Ldh family oxidoreductase [Clostridia bacterium]